ncbi:MAG TPA: hypothetical protein DCM05_04530 [Elusimicrobia bacterium]|nr:hypothetical protein [Elusimicrobiota bacterium]
MGKKTNGDKPAMQSDLVALRKATRADMQAMLDSGLAETKTLLRSEMDGMKKELKSDIARVAIGLVKTQSDLREVKENMFTKSDARVIVGSIDKLTQGLASYEYRLAVRKHQLNDHERRIRILERKPQA